MNEIMRREESADDCIKKVMIKFSPFLVSLTRYICGTPEWLPHLSSLKLSLFKQFTHVAMHKECDTICMTVVEVFST